MSDWKAKRFWTTTAVKEVDQGFAINLDGRMVKTPAKRDLVVPTQAMAEVLASEWDAQEQEIQPNTMPATKTANAAIDKVTIQHGEVAQMLAAYADSDLLCYRAENPESLVARQEATWDPMLDWLDQRLGARLEPRKGVIHVPQDPDTLDVLSQVTHAFNAFELAAFHDLVGISGSWVIGYAATTGEWNVDDLWRASRIDEDWQREQWGHDEEADAQANLKNESFLHAGRMFTLCCKD